MRINLATPFAEKDQAKALGARWDAARKVWYVEDVEDLTPFKRWIPELAGWDENKAKSKPDRKRKVAPTSVPTTGPTDVSQCSCSVLPWEDCEHTIEVASSAVALMAAAPALTPAPACQDGFVRLTREILEQHKTVKGGWTRAQLQAIGVGWPPPRGWVQAAIGREISAEDFRVFTRHGGPLPSLFD